MKWLIVRQIIVKHRGTMLEGKEEINESADTLVGFRKITHLEHR